MKKLCEYIIYRAYAKEYKNIGKHLCIRGECVKRRCARSIYGKHMCESEMEILICGGSWCVWCVCVMCGMGQGFVF